MSCGRECWPSFAPPAPSRVRPHPIRARAHVANAGPLPAIPDLAPAVERGHATVADAYQVRDEPAEVKRRAVEAVEAGEAPTLAGAVKRIRQEEAREQAIAEATNTPPVPNLRAAPIGELKSGVGSPGSDRAASTSSPRCRRRCPASTYFAVVEVVVVGRDPVRLAAAGRVLDKWAGTSPEAVMMSHQEAAAELAAIKKAGRHERLGRAEVYGGPPPSSGRASSTWRAPAAGGRGRRFRAGGRGARRGCRNGARPAVASARPRDERDHAGSGRVKPCGPSPRTDRSPPRPRTAPGPSRQRTRAPRTDRPRERRWRRPGWRHRSGACSSWAFSRTAIAKLTGVSRTTPIQSSRPPQAFGRADPATRPGTMPGRVTVRGQRRLAARPVRPQDARRRIAATGYRPSSSKLRR